MIKEEFWNTKAKIFEIPKYDLFELPKFKCPKCDEGLLIFDTQKMISEEMEQSKKTFEATQEIEYCEGFFSAFGKCYNPDCKEIVIISGVTKVKLYEWDEETGSSFPVYKSIYEIQYINPPIRLIDLPIDINNNIKDTLNKSFSLFWIDENACANKIRVVIEQLLDYLKVPKARTLHRRLEKLEDNPNLFKLLSAVKLIGNEGSHSPINLERKDLIDAYSIIELSLKDLFDKTREEINQIAIIINQKYGNSCVG